MALKFRLQELYCLQSSYQYCFTDIIELSLSKWREGMTHLPEGAEMFCFVLSTTQIRDDL